MTEEHGAEPAASDTQTGQASAAAGTAAAGWYPDTNAPGTGQQRYWDGTQWLGARPAPFLSERKSSEERKATLAQQIQFAVGRGMRVESQSDYQAVMAWGHPVNHILHAILTIFTCLLWGVIWAIIAATGGVHREMIVVDEYGNVQTSRLGRS